jgi:hypothetical protein
MQAGVPFRELNTDQWSEMTFLNSFEGRYQRNNKKGGLKNLRCFPHHSRVHKPRGFCGTSVRVALVPAGELSTRDAEVLTTTGEESTCRTSVSNDATKANDNKSIKHQRRLFSWATFTPLDAQPLVSVGDVLDLDTIMDQEFTVDNPSRSWIRGEELLGKRRGRTTSDEDTENVAGSLPLSATVIEFNQRLKGWHYGWAANKHNCDTLHCFQVMTFEPFSTQCDKQITLADGTKPSAGATLVRCCAVGSSPSFVLFCRRRHRFSGADEAPEVSSSVDAEHVDSVLSSPDHAMQAPSSPWVQHISNAQQETCTQDSISKLLGSLIGAHSSASSSRLSPFNCTSTRYGTLGASMLHQQQMFEQQQHNLSQRLLERCNSARMLGNQLDDNRTNSTPSSPSFSLAPGPSWAGSSNSGMPSSQYQSNGLRCPSEYNGRSDNTEKLMSQRLLLAEAMAVQASRNAMIQRRFAHMQRQLALSSLLPQNESGTARHSMDLSSLIGWSASPDASPVLRDNPQDENIAQFLLGMAHGRGSSN